MYTHVLICQGSTTFSFYFTDCKGLRPGPSNWKTHTHTHTHAHAHTHTHTHTHTQDRKPSNIYFLPNADFSRESSRGQYTGWQKGNQRPDTQLGSHGRAC